MKGGYDVTVIAKNVPGDIDPYYASPFAGAQWMSFANEDEIRFQNWDKAGYYEFLRLAKEEPTSGIHEVKLDRYIEKNAIKDYKPPWVRYLVKNYKELTPENHRFPDPKIVGGFQFSTVTITTSHYLSFLYRKVIEHGGTIKRVNLSHINDANKFHASGAKPDLIVNATGLFARYLGGVEDKKMYPIKGQIVILTNSLSQQYVNETLSDSVLENEAFYIFPRKEGGCIVGGLYQALDPETYQDYDTTKVDPELTKRILARARKYVPELTDNTKFPGNKKELDVVTQYVAFRPGRKGGIRLEREDNIIHNYGAGGTGYQSSYGTAAEVVQLADDFIQKKKGAKL